MTDQLHEMILRVRETHGGETYVVTTHGLSLIHI